MELGWVDFSRDDRNRIMKTLDLLEDHTALDELGVGIIRDGFADILFPGISTLHTRAKYLVLIPYLFTLAEKQKFRTVREVTAWIHRKEFDLVGTLKENSDTSKATGIIGLFNYEQNKTVKAKPSAIYWSALRTFEILKNQEFSFKNACDIVYTKSKQSQNITIQTQGESFDDITAANQNIVVFSPLPLSYSLENDTSIELTPSEAAFLFDKITNAQKPKDTLLAFLLKNNFAPSKFEEIGTADLPEHLRNDYNLASDFADFIVGAHIRYNVIYSGYQDVKMMQEYNEWKDAFPFENFNLSKILSRVNGNISVNTFLEKLLKLTKAGDDESVDQLIISREREIKRDRAKLNNPTIYKYNPDAPVHYYKFDYRYNTAKRIIADILARLGGEA